ncbi:hypothetical protein [Crossiella cryophila]|uniref:PA domain-containing protein n=1 Tax=Crossiella cryophila TaxID=43355 RepID=A0A7W7CIB3_9PSEU|nr:hypothetical protein [Crossiella cryophila]MBB4680268.1 hypothetical protein [Crossiella cryophila]
MARRRTRLGALVAALTVLAAGLAPVGAAGPGECPAVVDERSLADVGALRDWTATMAGFGLRGTGSAAHRATVDWVERRVRRLPGMVVRSEEFPLLGWQPRRNDLAAAGGLALTGLGTLPVAGAIPYSEPGSAEGPLVYLPGAERITAGNARGKIVLRDFPEVDRGYLAEPALERDLIDAGIAGVAGLVVVFDFPLEQVRGYWEPHPGTHFRVPGVFVGVDEGVRLKQVAAVGGAARVSVAAQRRAVTTRNLIATLPGRSAERIVFDTNTDGNTWVQDNGVAGLLALAEYFARLPARCRSRTLEFVFASAHLHRSAEGSERRARVLDAEYDAGSVAFAFVLEHLGTREVLPVPRAGGPGRELVHSGAAEQAAWFAGSPRLTEAAGRALSRRELDRVTVLAGIDKPDPVRVPPQCSFGGIGSHFHRHLIPTTAMISGPWSLWAPSFGAGAIDHSRLRQQVLAAGDVVLELATVPLAQLAGDYPEQRRARAAGAPTCSHQLPPEWAPGQ